MRNYPGKSGRKELKKKPPVIKPGAKVLSVLSVNLSHFQSNTIMGNYPNSERYLTAIVVMRGEGGEIVFHKYRNIPSDPRRIARFQRFAYTLGDRAGVLMHINFYFKDSKRFSHQWKCSFAP